MSVVFSGYPAAVGGTVKDRRHGSTRGSVLGFGPRETGRSREDIVDVFQNPTYPEGMKRLTEHTGVPDMFSSSSRPGVVANTLLNHCVNR